MDDQSRAFLEVALPHLDVIYRVALHMTGDHHRAEDLVQETYLRAYGAFAGHRGSTKAWLVTICANLARDEGRRRGRRVAEAPLPEAYDPPARSRDVADQAMANLDRAAVSRALAQVPDDQRLALVLMDLAGHSASEVAEMLGCPRNTVLSRAFRGRQRLALLLTEEGVKRDVP
jgi:RNA polymerase sigma-70 factor (ECF subfamily)